MAEFLTFFYVETFQGLVNYTDRDVELLAGANNRGHCCVVSFRGKKLVHIFFALVNGNRGTATHFEIKVKDRVGPAGRRWECFD
jgi:hypothetical protein